MICGIHSRSLASQYRWLVDADRVPVVSNNCGARTDDADDADDLDVSNASDELNGMSVSL